MTAALFGFSDPDEKKLPLLFERPIKTYSAAHLTEITPLLKSVEASTSSGCWAVLLLSYEAAPAFDTALKTHSSPSLPLAWAAVFDKPPIEDTKHAAGSYEVSPWQPRITREQFYEAVGKIRELIARGDTYQVNFTFPLVSKFAGDARAWYRDLCLSQGAQYCAYIDLGRYQVLSMSPELFFARAGAAIKTRPMKGTINRGRWMEEDVEMARLLADSAKDRAENVMIVDLLRNDLGKVAEPGTVGVTQLFEIERYQTLWQMTTTVEAKLRRNVGTIQLMEALFPCGSITGAPKIRTMEIIRDLETYPRGAYTGTLGFLQPGGDCVFNVAIRTVVIDSETGIASFGVGGGITYDSSAEQEYDECLLKSSFLNSRDGEFRLFESLLLENGEIFLPRRHLARLKASADYFGFRFPQTMESDLESIPRKHPAGTWKVRLLLSKEGETEWEASELSGSVNEPLRVCFAASPVDSTNRFLFHKTTKREVYDRVLAERADCADVILWNERGEITESTIANVVVAIDGRLWTPPRTAGLLAGTFREELLNQGTIHERVIRKEELKAGDSFFQINSVRKWMSAILVD